jgi:hypothetical protein
MENLLNFVSSISNSLGISESPIGDSETSALRFYTKQSLEVKTEIHKLKNLLFKRFSTCGKTEFSLVPEAIDCGTLLVAIAIAKSQKSLTNLRGIDISVDQLPDFDRAFQNSLETPKKGPRKATKDILLRFGGEINRMRSEGLSWGKIKKYLEKKHKVKIADTTLMRNFQKKGEKDAQ